MRAEPSSLPWSRGGGVARRLYLLTLFLVALAGCKERQAPAPPPAGGDGQLELQRLDRAHPEAGVIVVLGSSTAAGVGASKAEAAWVPRYRAHLSERFPRFAVVNLSVPGYTTYHVQPTGYAPAAKRPKPVPGKNIDAALALRPHAIIVNLPSNDQAAGYGWEEQLANYDRLAAAAARAGVELWVSTTQPRNFEEADQRRALLAARDALRRRFGGRTLEFWLPLALADGRIRPEHDSGDGIHLDDSGHAHLARAVVDAGIPEMILASRD